MKNEYVTMAHALCLEIEKLPASEQQTACSLLASNLHMKLHAAFPDLMPAEPQGGGG